MTAPTERPAMAQWFDAFHVECERLRRDLSNHPEACDVGEAHFYLGWSPMKAAVALYLSTF